VEVILDSNVLFKMLISRGNIFEVFFHPDLRIIAPERLLIELERNYAEIARKSKLSETELEEAKSDLLLKINFVNNYNYRNLFTAAGELLKGHTKDEDFVALHLLTRSKIWTYEDRLFKMGVAISTKEIADKLKKE